MRVVTFTEAKNHLSYILDQGVENVDYTIIKRRNAGDTVVMSFDTFNSYLETFHLLKSRLTPNIYQNRLTSITVVRFRIEI